MLNVECFLFLFFLLFAGCLHAAEQFGDVSVAPGAIYTGNTCHGYAETRVALENHSASRAHTVTLVFPNYSYNNGNSLSRVSRTVKLDPGAREVVSLFQPPLPANGDGNWRVEVDGHREGQIRAPNANNHLNGYSGRGETPVAFVSRSFDFDAVNDLLHPDGGTGGTPGMYSPASQAAGPPRAARAGRKDLSLAWMPDRRIAAGHWLEVDYAPELISEKIVVHSLLAPLRLGSVVAIGVSGTNLLTLPMSAGNNVSDTNHCWNVEFTFPPTAEPVKTVRLDFGAMPAGTLAIDGVQISGASSNEWASTARASSENSAAMRGSRGYGSVGEDIECLRAESPVGEWSEHWLAYTPFDAVLLSAADLGAMPPAVSAALGDYLSAGGNIFVLGRGELPPGWHSPQQKNRASAVDHAVGFGHCFTFDVENVALLDAKSVQLVREAARSSALYWQSLPRDSNAANSALKVVENLKVPLRGIVVIMLAFILLIGPVNIIYLNRRKRRTWMLWTIPAISFVTTLIVFAYSLLREGITPDTRIAGLTLVDQASHHATTIGATAFYCPLTPSRGLQFDYETEATPLVQTGYGSGSSREVDWTQSQHFGRGWVSARVPAHFHLRKSETRRERIQVVNEEGKLQILNGLGAPIKSIWVAYPTPAAAHLAAGLNFYHAENVAAGQKGALTSVELHPSPLFAGAEGMLRDFGFAPKADALDSVANTAAMDLLPNSYLAVLEGNPFIENALGAASSPLRTKTSAVVFGILEGDK